MRRIALAAGLVLAACAGTQATPPVQRSAIDTWPVAGEFDRARSQALLAQAQQAEAAGDRAAAEQLYRDAGLAWPDTAEAWEEVRKLALARGDAEEARGAAFMLERARLYPSDQIFVQREVNMAVRHYVAAQAEAPTDGQPSVIYARHLVAFYNARYAERGIYVPEPDYGNLEAGDVPAALATAGTAIGYGASLLINAE